LVLYVFGCCLSSAQEAESNRQGSVRVEAVVAPDGSARTVEIKGGHPLLAQAAHDAVQKWKWVPAPKQTRELIEVKFILSGSSEYKKGRTLMKSSPKRASCIVRRIGS
jgi:TonB family protein